MISQYSSIMCDDINNIKVDISDFSFESDIYSIKPYYYIHRNDINWKHVLDIINGQIAILSISFEIYFLNNDKQYSLHSVQVAAIITHYMQIDNMHDTLITVIKKEIKHIKPIIRRKIISIIREEHYRNILDIKYYNFKNIHLVECFMTSYHHKWEKKFLTECNTNILKYFFDNLICFDCRKDKSRRTVKMICMYGNYDIIKYLIDNNTENIFVKMYCNDKYNMFGHNSTLSVDNKIDLIHCIEQKLMRDMLHNLFTKNKC